MRGWILILIVVILLIIAVPLSIKLISHKILKTIEEKKGNFFNESNVDKNVNRVDNFFNVESSEIKWTYEKQEGWTVTGNPPDCPELSFESPADLNLVTSVLYPGQYRSEEYKPHGGLRFDNSLDNKIDVVAPFDGKVVDGSRYLVDGEIQYYFDILNDCGILYRLGHLKTLSSKFVGISENLREPVEGDSSSTFVVPIDIEKGELVATEIGLPENYFFDFGVYDLRNKNSASEDSGWLAEHNGEFAPYAICWLNFLGEENSAKIISLPGGDYQSGTQSDYC